MLLKELLEVKQAGYIIDTFKPESVKQRSLNYLQNSYDIHTIFTELFEMRQDENKELYLNWKGDAKEGDKDWTLTKIVSKLRNSEGFRQLSKSKQKEYNVEEITKFFKTNKIYKGSVYRSTDKHADMVRDWRLKPVEMEDVDDDC